MAPDRPVDLPGSVVERPLPHQTFEGVRLSSPTRRAWQTTRNAPGQTLKGRVHQNIPNAPTKH